MLSREAILLVMDKSEKLALARKKVGGVSVSEHLDRSFFFHQQLKKFQSKNSPQHPSPIISSVTKPSQSIVTASIKTPLTTPTLVGVSWKVRRDQASFIIAL